MPGVAVILATAAIALYLVRAYRKAPTVEQGATERRGSSGIVSVAQRPAQTSSSNSFASIAQTAATTNGAPLSTAAVTATNEATEVAGIASATNLAPATILENMRAAIRDYGSMFGGNPVGTNIEITRALNGDNPKEAKFIRAEAGLRLNGKGELIDSWGTPFFFHQLSGTEMEIRSAGPDKVMWTADDLVTR